MISLVLLPVISLVAAVIAITPPRLLRSCSAITRPLLLRSCSVSCLTTWRILHELRGRLHPNNGHQWSVERLRNTATQTEKVSFFLLFCLALAPFTSAFCGAGGWGGAFTGGRLPAASGRAGGGPAGGGPGGGGAGAGGAGAVGRAGPLSGPGAARHREAPFHDFASRTRIVVLGAQSQASMQYQWHGASLLCLSHTQLSAIQETGSAGSSCGPACTSQPSHSRRRSIGLPDRTANNKCYNVDM